MQAQLSGQCISLPDRSSFPTWGSSRSWQSDADVNLRRRVIEIITPIFQKCRHQLLLEWQQKIPDLVTTVEQALYNEASSKEEYADFRTLEQRLQIMTPKFVNNTGTQQQHRNTNPLDDLSSALIGNSNNNMVNSMVPTPGFSNNMMPTPGSNGTVRTMMPTPGLNTNKTTNSNMIPTPGGIGNFVQTSTGMFQVNGMRMMHDAASAGFSTGSMQMMPTPGISMPQQTAVSSGNFPKSSDMSMNSIQPQQYPTANGHMVRKPLNAGGGLTNGMMVNRNHLVNGHDYPVQSMQGQSHFQNQSQFLLQQQQQQQQRLSRMQQMTNSMNATANGSYAMNAADLAGNANIYTSTGLISNGMALNTVNPQLKLPLNSVHQSQNIVHQQMQQSLQQQRLQQQQLQPQQQQQQQQQQSVPLQRQEHPTFQISEKKPEIQNVSIDIPMPDQQPQQQQSSPQIQEQQQIWQQAKSENHVTPQNNELVQAKPEPILPMEDVKPDVKQEPEQAQPVKQEQGSLPMVSTPGAENNNGGQQVVSSMRAQQYQKQQRWLLFLHHASKCKAPAGSCTHNPHCGTGKQLLSHIARCRTYECTYERCPASRKLLFHHQKCRDINCPVCGRVRQLILKHQSREPSPREGVSSIQPPSKRVKVEPVPDSTNIHEYSENHPMKSEPSKPSKMNVKTEAQTVKPEAEVKPNIPVVNNEVINGKGLKPKTIGASLTELFTVEQIRQHITSLRQWVGQSKSKVEKIQAMEHQSNEQACRLCGVEKLFFDPPPIYCTTCGIRVKRNALYYTTAIRDTRHYFCIPCYNDVRTENVELEGLTYPKNVLEKHKHDEEQEEAWVFCERCNLWQHQICALFNSRRNEGGEADYTCPQCCMAEMERGERLPLPESAVLGAKDLPKTYLSDHLEKRLTEKLRQERLERARAQGKSFDEVPGAEGLVVRVVSSVDKKLEVKPRFLEIFQEEDYPTEFPYKSKAVLLFQRIEGVEVCLYGMYVQEFGVESAQPNERRVYLSYLDSVKYFRPEVKTLHGEALRTYVYHELLVGYLDYCKRRGFTSCYIWACPPLKGEDYILYCHPEIQKTPKSDKLREWYLTMLRKASRDNIVVDVTNFYDYFFVSQGECKAKVTAARLPYFDGDYWPGAAEDIILQLQQQQDSDDGNKQKKGKIKKPPTKRNTKTAAAAEMGVNASKDTQLMLKLGESIMPMKEDFIMVHLYHTCTHCRNFILSGYRWICRVCKTFQLCDRCYDADVKLDERERHPFNNKEVHHLSPVAVDEVSGDTKDKDDIMESEFFDTRHAFLTLCQGNHYQYDTLRRAKHSSMMVLYHLHNPMAPAFVTTCSICNHDIETGQGWKCDTCTEYDVCNGCYQEEGRKHPHRLIPHPSASERNAQNKEARQQRMLQLKKMLELLVHASNCGTQQCQYPMCVNVKRLFRHGGTCQKRVSGNCLLCKRMWNILQIHARTCKESQCRVPRCKDLKEHLRRSILQMESRRRAAVMEMMRQRTAETAGRKQ